MTDGASNLEPVSSIDPIGPLDWDHVEDVGDVDVSAEARAYIIWLLTDYVRAASAETQYARFTIGAVNRELKALKKRLLKRPKTVVAKLLKTPDIVMTGHHAYVHGASTKCLLEHVARAVAEWRYCLAQPVFPDGPTPIAVEALAEHCYAFPTPRTGTVGGQPSDKRRASVTSPDVDPAEFIFVLLALTYQQCGGEMAWHYKVDGEEGFERVHPMTEFIWALNPALPDRFAFAKSVEDLSNRLSYALSKNKYLLNH